MLLILGNVDTRKDEGMRMKKATNDGPFIDPTRLLAGQRDGAVTLHALTGDSRSLPAVAFVKEGRREVKLLVKHLPSIH